MCEDSTCNCSIDEGTDPFDKRLYVDPDGRVYYHEVRLPFLCINGRLWFRVKETWLRRKYGSTVIVSLEDLQEILCKDDP